MEVITQDIYLRDYLLNKYTKKEIKRIKSKGDLLVNGKHQTVRYYLKKGDCLQVCLPTEESNLEAYDYPLKIIYEDDYYLVVDKEQGMPSIPCFKYPNKTLANALTYYYKQNNIYSKVHLVNRLDLETSGLLLVAKSSQAHQLLSKDIKQVNRIYHALVRGKIDTLQTIDKPILKIDNQIARVIDERGKKAITKIIAFKEIGENTLVSCQLETGRTHQIRLHLKSINHPIINDPIYDFKSQDKMYLRSVKLSFYHPYLKKELEFIVK